VIGTVYGYARELSQVMCNISFSTGETDYMDYNLTSKLFEYKRTFNETMLNHTNVESRMFTWNISCTKNGYVVQNSSNNNVTVYNKNASLEIFDQEDDDENKAAWMAEHTVQANEMTYFFANYTDRETNRSLNEFGLRNILSTDPGSYMRTIAFADLNNDGIKEYLIVGYNENLNAYYPNGSLYWISTVPSGAMYEIDVGDLNNDGYYNDIVTTESGDYVRVFNRTGGQVWNSGDIGNDVYSIKIGDLDKDGLNDDFVIGYHNGTSYTISGYNTSNHTGWSRMWTFMNTTIMQYPYEVDIGVMNSSYDYNLITTVTYDYARPLLLYSHNGSLVYYLNSDLGYIRSAALADLNNDGNEDEQLYGEENELRAYQRNGSVLWTKTEPTSYIWDILTGVDLNNDGLAQEIVIGDTYYVRAFNRTGTSLWATPFQPYERYIYSVWADDLNNDGSVEILAGGEGDILYIYNRTGGLMYQHSVKQETLSTYSNIGSALGTNPQIRTSDSINGTKLIGFTAYDTGVYLEDPMPKCTIYFNDTIKRKMYYNSSVGMYYYNRTFSTPGTYTWNISCLSENNIDQNSTTQTITVNSMPDQGAPTAAAHQPIHGREDDNLISYWQFEHESNKTGIAVDSVGGNNGTLSGVTFTDEGAIGSAYEFDGNDRIATTVTTQFTDFTISLWFKDDGDNRAYERIADKSYTGGFWIGRQAGTANSWGGGIKNASSPYGIYITLPDKQWNHLVFMRRGNNHTIIGNGGQSVKSQIVSDTALDTTALAIGGYGAGGTESQWFTGSIDEVMVYDRALTAEEIYQIFRDGNISLASNVTSDQDLGASAVNQTDADANLLKNIFNWYKNETSISVLNMPFEGGSNTTWTKDYSPYGNNGTVSGATWNATGGVDGRGAYMFDGVNDYIINHSSINSVDVESAGTISAWIKPRTNSINSIIAGRVGSTGNWYDGRMVIYTRTTGTIGFNIADGSSSNAQITTAASYYSPDTWYHVVGTFNNTKYTIYVNGNYINSNTIAYTPEMTGTSFKVGYWNGLGYFNGSIDEVHIYNHSLSPEQIRALYMLEYNRIASNETRRGEVWKACITPNDGSSDGTTNCTNNVTIVNAPPETNRVMFNSTGHPTRTNDNLTCYINAEDIDGDTMTAYYNIYNNSIQIPALGGSQGSITTGTPALLKTINSANTTKGEIWVCEAKLNDGFINETIWHNDSARIVQISNTISIKEGGTLKISDINVALKLNEID